MVQITDLSPGENDDASSRDGERLRLAGNAFFATGDYTSAAKAYASSLAAAPPPSGSAAAALGNRVVALIKLGRLREALADAERCVTVCPPGSPYAAKARFREGEALEAIGDLRGAREVRVGFPKSRLPVCWPFLTSTAVIKRKYLHTSQTHCESSITPTVYSGHTTKYCRLSRVITHTSYGKTDPFFYVSRGVPRREWRGALGYVGARQTKKHQRGVDEIKPEF